MPEQKTVWVDNRPDKTQPLPEWWGDDSIWPTYEEAQEAVRKVGEMIAEYKEQNRPKFIEPGDDLWIPDRDVIINI